MNPGASNISLACAVLVQLAMLTGCTLVFRKKHIETWLLWAGAMLLIAGIWYIHNYLSLFSIRITPDIFIFKRIQLSGLILLTLGLLGHAFRVRAEDRQIAELETRIANQHSRLADKEHAP